jgi:putative ABC transport system permease protein
MNFFQLIRRSLRFFWRTNAGIVLGTALSALVLTGALFVGDSVKATLRRQAEARVGRVDEAFVAGERFVHWNADPAKRADRVGGLFVPGANAAGVLLMQGTAARPDQAARANRIQVVGVDEMFWKLSPSAQVITLPANEVALNARLAAQLRLKAGDELILRLEKPAAFSKDAPLSGEESDLVTLRARVARVVEDADFARFALTSGQVPPPSVFVPLATLQTRLGLAGKANIVLDAERGSRPGKSQELKAPTGVAVDQAKPPDRSGLLADADIAINELPQGLGLEVRTSRVFLDEATVAAARRNERETPGLPAGMDALTYFVNELRAGDGTDTTAKATPYSMITALDAPASGFVPAELAEDEITITRWLADDLGVDVGSKITIKYFVMGERRQLVEKSRTFTVLGPILEMSEPQLNTSWMPDFPNIPDKGNFSKWKPGFPYDSNLIRKKDEDYWDEYRGTPKAFVNLRVGQEMWGNRWGNLTSIRYPGGTQRELVERMASFIEPAALGFRVVPLRAEALAATNAPVDFGQLFAGFSFFLILAAAVLTGLLFTFSIEQRAAEAGLLLAVGWQAKQVRRLFLREGFALALLGAVIGALLAALYTQAVLRGLSSVWSGATGGTHFFFAPSPITFAIGIASAVIVALLAMWLASRRLFKQEAAVLLAGSANPDAEAQLLPANAPRRWWEWTRRAIEVLAVAGTIYLLVAQPKNPILFFIAGFLLLAAGLSVSFRRLRAVARSHGELPTAGALALRNTSRRRGRSLATIGVLASGVFMVVAVDSFRKGPLDDPTRRESGTGGFTLIGESSSPIYEDLNTAKGREQYALDDEIMGDARIVQLRARSGDDASCLNLNRAIQPRLVGVNFGEMHGRFAAGALGHWEKMTLNAPEGVPALVDANTLQWAMQKKVGDFLDYQDDRGRALRVQIAATFPASILQGMVLINEPEFTARFPNHAGYSMFLIECPPAKADAIREHLSQQLGDRGLEIVPAATRLAEFNAVENTYLSIFQILGGLGLLLGSAGLGIVVARNILERRREFGLLEAVGFTPRQLRALVFAEHRWLIVFALGVGALSALVAVWPNLSQRGGGFPWRQAAVLLAGMAILGAFWTWLATRISLRGSLLPALRNE